MDKRLERKGWSVSYADLVDTFSIIRHRVEDLSGTVMLSSDEYEVYMQLKDWKERGRVMQPFTAGGKAGVAKRGVWHQALVRFTESDTGLPTSARHPSEPSFSKIVIGGIVPDEVWRRRERTVFEMNHSQQEWRIRNKP